MSKTIAHNLLESLTLDLSETALRRIVWRYLDENANGEDREYFASIARDEVNDTKRDVNAVYTTAKTLKQAFEGVRQCFYLENN